MYRLEVVPVPFTTPPEAAYYNESTVLNFKHIIRGLHGMGAAYRYGDVECHFRVRGDKQYRSTRGVRKSANREAVTVEFTIPSVAKATSSLLRRAKLM